MKLIAATLFSLVITAGCGDTTTSIGDGCGSVLLLRKPSDIVVLGSNQSVVLAVTSPGWPDECHVRMVDWTSDAPGVARIQSASDTTATLTGQSPGTAHIIAQLRGFAVTKTLFTVTVGL